MEIEVENTLVKPAQEAVYEKRYVLSLSQKEAQFLFDVTQKISGDPFLSRRCYADKLRHALRDVGLKRIPSKANKYGAAEDMVKTGGISFVNQSPNQSEKVDETGNLSG